MGILTPNPDALKITGVPHFSRLLREVGILTPNPHALKITGVPHFSRFLREVGCPAAYTHAQSCHTSPFTRENSDTFAVTSVT